MDDFDKLSRKIHRNNPAVRQAWIAAQPMLQAVLLLIRMRKGRKLSQAEVASRAGWNKSFVSRLESGRGGVPDSGTMQRYAKACNAHLGWVVAFEEEDGIVVNYTAEVGQNEPLQNVFQPLRGFDLSDERTATAAG